MSRYFFTAAIFLATLISAFGSPLKSDEMVVFFPGYGSRVDAHTWELDVRGWIFEWERRPGVSTAFNKLLGIDKRALSTEERALLNARTKLFLVDAERNKRLSIHIAGRVYELKPSDVTGHFSDKITIADSEMVKVNNSVSFHAITKPGDTRTFAGTIQLIEPEGLSVISDLDDTIKVSNVLDRKKLLQNTFLKPFEPAAGMSALYQGWATNSSVSFHYLSASPSQLYTPLAEFLADHNFPLGSFHLRAFNWRTEFQNHSVPKKHKPAVLENFMKKFPKRRFILVGDSGESDPEIYADLTRKFPERIEHILIRDVTGESAESARYREAFTSIDPAIWSIFKDPSEIARIPAEK
ncbi:MAG: DUF2183 domain-containing protein [Verrucomicrobia bacterium]|nr:DUF2183 domain-containing protein [Verrucomicrobiota bacterium]